MEKVIDNKGKFVDVKEEENKFEKVSEKMVVVGDVVEKKLD